MTDENVTLIVRSIGERTEEKCISYLEKQFHTKDVKVIRNVTPFSEAIRETMNIGAKGNKKWTLVLDADIFLFEEKLPRLFDISETILGENECLFCVLLSVFDNFLGYSRSAGIHLYYTKYMEKALKFTPNHDLRPETYVIRNMSFAGYPSYRIYETIGIHDFFQSYQSIVSKGVLHCKKHASIAEIRKMWESNRDMNIEFDYLCRAAEISDTINPEDLGGVNGDYIKELVSRYIDEFPPQPELTDTEIEEVLAKYKNEAVYEKMKFQRLVHVGIFQKIGRKVDKLLYVKKKD